MKVQIRVIQARFVEIHQVSAKQNKVGHFSNSVVYRFRCFFAGDSLEVAWRLSALKLLPTCLMHEMGIIRDCLGRNEGIWTEITLVLKFFSKYSYLHDCQHLMKFSKLWTRPIPCMSHESAAPSVVTSTSDFQLVSYRSCEAFRSKALRPLTAISPLLRSSLALRTKWLLSKSYY